IQSDARQRNIRHGDIWSYHLYRNITSLQRSHGFMITGRGSFWPSTTQATESCPLKTIFANSCEPPSLGDAYYWGFRGLLSLGRDAAGRRDKGANWRGRRGTNSKPSYRSPRGPHCIRNGVRLSHT